MLGGAAGIGAIKHVGDLSQRLTYLGIQANASDAEIAKLHSSIIKVAQDKDIRVDPSGILEGVEVIVEKLGDLGIAEGNLRNIGLAMRATGAEGKAVGDMIANFKEKFDLKPEEMLPALDILVKQGKAGAFTLKDMVTQGNRVTAAYGSMGRKGLPAVREMGAMLQVFRKSSGSAEETSTAFKNFFSDLMEPGKQKVLKANGISIWDPEKLKEGKKVVRSAVDIIDELLRKSKGDPEKLAKVFGMQSLDGVKAFISTWQSSGKNAALEFMNINGDGAELMADSARASKEFNAAIQNLQTSWQKFAKQELTKPVKDMADYLNGLKPGTVDRWMTVAKWIAIIGGSAIVARKGYGMYEFGRQILGGKGGKGGLGGLAGGGAAPIPVYVVNQPGGIPGVGGAGGAGAGAAAARAGIGFAGGAAIAIPLTTALLARPIAKAISEERVKSSSTTQLREMLNGHMVMGGGASTYQAKLIASELQKRGAQDVNGLIKIVIDQDNRARIDTLKSHNNIKFDVDNGMMMVSH
jgi:TP901 family phage tail tape measure protein